MHIRSLIVADWGKIAQEVGPLATKRALVFASSQVSDQLSHETTDGRQQQGMNDPPLCITNFRTNQATNKKEAT